MTMHLCVEGFRGEREAIPTAAGAGHRHLKERVLSTSLFQHAHEKERCFK